MRSYKGRTIKFLRGRLGNFFVHVFFSCQSIKHVGFLFSVTFHCKIFFFTHTYVLLILFAGIYATKNSHVALLSYIPVQLYTRNITDYDIKLICTGAEKA